MNYLTSLFFVIMELPKNHPLFYVSQIALHQGATSDYKLITLTVLKYSRRFEKSHKYTFIPFCNKGIHEICRAFSDVFIVKKYFGFIINHFIGC